MKVLVGTILAGHSKDYALPKFVEMRESILADHDVICAVDEPHRTPTSMIELWVSEMHGSPWATEIVYHGKNALRNYAMAMGYDALVWQGIDCYYTRRGELERLIRQAGPDTPIIGGLVAGRNKPGYAVCRRFVGDSREQVDHIEFQHTHPVKGPRPVRGYIGSDATVITREALETVSMAGYEHWHLVKDTCPLRSGALGPEEWFMWSAITRNGIVPVVDASVRPWHAHETGGMARYPGETMALDDLHWE